MPATDFTTAGLIAEIKREIVAPSQQDLYSDEDFCSAMTSVQRSEIVPYVISAVEGYFEADYSFSTVAGTLEYLLPARSVGMKLESVALVSGTNRQPVHYVSQAQMDAFIYSQQVVYTLRGNYLRFPPGYSGGDTIALRYYRAPSALVPTSHAGKILAIAGDILTLDNVPSGWAADTVVDIHRGSPPFQPIEDDISLIAVNGFDVEVPDASSYAVGDWVCFQYQCVIPQIPLELFPILTAYSGLQFLEGFGSAEEVSLKQKNYQKLKDNLFTLITPRNVSSPKSAGPCAAFRYRR